jgi:sulfofructose kinase
MKVAVERYREAGGGMAATAAVAIAALGGEAHFWGRLGADPAGDTLATLLTGAGVMIDALRLREGGRTPVSSILVDRNGERLLAFFTGTGLDDDAGWLPRPRIAGVGAVLCDVRWFEGALSVLTEAGARSIPRILDADITPDSHLPTLVALSDHALFSSEGLQEFCGRADLERGLREAQALTRGIVGVTIGADGFLWLDRGVPRREPGFRIAVTDTNGAGDTFHGAYALKIAEGADVTTAARFANAAAAAKCARGGGWTGMPNRELVEILITERRNEDFTR